MREKKWLEVLGWSQVEVDHLRYVAHSYIKQGIYDVALTFFDAIQVLTTPTAYDLQTVGALYLQLGNATQSLLFLDRALAMDPTNAPTQLNRAKALLMLKRTQEALLLARRLEQSSVPEIVAQATALILSQH